MLTASALLAYFVTALGPLGSPAAEAHTTVSAGRSVMTDLQRCKIVRRDEIEGDLTRKCPGVGGFSLLLQESDARMSLDVVSPDGKVHTLQYWSVVSNEFSKVGTKAEWRVAGGSGTPVPVALIVPFYVDQVSENRTTGAESHMRMRYLVVAKVAKDDTCVTDKIEDAPTAAARARVAADTAPTRSCLPGRETEKDAGSGSVKAR